jgi:hypothetical protein
MMALLREAGWHVSFKSVERIWRREGLNVPQRQHKRSRLWLMTDRASDCSRNIRVLRRMPSNSTKGPSRSVKSTRHGSTIAGVRKLTTLCHDERLMRTKCGEANLKDSLLPK